MYNQCACGDSNYRRRSVEKVVSTCVFVLGDCGKCSQNFDEIFPLGPTSTAVGGIFLWPMLGACNAHIACRLGRRNELSEGLG